MKEEWHAASDTGKTEAGAQQRWSVALVCRPGCQARALLFRRSEAAGDLNLSCS